MPADEEIKAAHRNFWKVSKHYECFQKAAIVLKHTLNLDDHNFAYLMNRDFGVTMKVKRTLRRFFEAGERRPFSNDPERLTWLFLVCHRICQENRTALISKTAGIIPHIKEIANSIKSNPDLLLQPKSKRTVRRNPSSYAIRYEALKLISDSIYVPPGEDDPLNPEFPPNSPHFPATPVLRLRIRGRDICIKDESRNPTGSHKDRWAWEKLVQYRNNQIFYALQSNKPGDLVDLPHLSMISAGSAAFALQTLLRLHGLPPLRVILDQKRVKEGTITALRSIGAELFFQDLDDRELHEIDVLQITKNEIHGVDITTRFAMTPNKERFYDWLVYEILNETPNHIFVPFGTGDLFMNIIFLLEETRNPKNVRDRRLQVVLPDKINVYGATSSDPQTRMDKLYARFRPTDSELTIKLQKLISDGAIGSDSGIFQVNEPLADEAARLARSENINTELSGIAGLALFLDRHKSNKIADSDKVLVVNTGWLRAQSIS
jgi:cysteine synthase